MRLTVHAVGGRMPSWVDEAVTEYGKRLPRELQLAWRDLPLAQRSRRGGDPVGQEGEALLKGTEDGDWVVALDVRGRAWSTEELAAQLQRWQLEARPVSLLIGGPDGLSRACLERADQRWSLSPLTLPHPLVRVVLVEQLYRAWTINAGHPYHRG
jgi:23S rRNA (pseudouridine1915-N3)-methyltransferase